MTGDHIVPKSDLAGLRRSIAYGLDQLEATLYGRVLRITMARFRSDPLAGDVSAIKQYDVDLPKDLRNIQPLCSYCNSTKGKRAYVDVDLYPDQMLLKRRPHEAPF
jgi:hypothetical protein